MWKAIDSKTTMHVLLLKLHQLCHRQYYNGLLCTTTLAAAHFYTTIETTAASPSPASDRIAAACECPGRRRPHANGAHDVHRHRAAAVRSPVALACQAFGAVARSGRGHSVRPWRRTERMAPDGGHLVHRAPADTNDSRPPTVSCGVWRLRLQQQQRPQRQRQLPPLLRPVCRRCCCCCPRSR